MFIALSVRLAPAAMALALASSATGEVATDGAPAVGVITAEYRSMTESTEINGRIQSRQRVDLVARVTAFLNERLFERGRGQEGPVALSARTSAFEADVEAKQAAVAEGRSATRECQFALAALRSCFRNPPAPRSRWTMRSRQQRTGGRAIPGRPCPASPVADQSRITPRSVAPIDGRIGRTSVTIGNVVSPTTGVLATIVSPDPMYVVFPVSVRRVLDLRDRYADKGGFDAVRIQLRLPNGRMYDQVGKLDFVDIRVARDTDTIVLRGTIPNPVCDRRTARCARLADDMFVSVLLEAVEPLKVLAVPRGCSPVRPARQLHLCRQSQEIAEQRRVKLGQSTPETAAVIEGLNAGERVIVEGVQRARPNAAVAPAPASPPPGPRLTNDVVGIHPPPPVRDRHRHRHGARGVAGADAHSGRPIARHRASASRSHRRLSRRLGRGAGSDGGAADRIQGRRRRQDDLHEEQQRQPMAATTLTVSFELGTDPDINTVNVNNRVQTAMASLPREVQLQGLTVQKRSSSLLQFISLYSEGGKLDPLFITNYGIINVLDELSRTPGVGQAILFGRLDYSMRIWFDTSRLTSLGLAPSDVIAAVQAQNVQAPVGRLGARPVPEDQQFQLNMQTQGRLTTTDEFGEIVLRANPDGSVLRIRDVARVELGAQNQDVESSSQRRTGRTIGIYLAPGANAIQMAAARECDPRQSAPPLPAGFAGARRLRFHHFRQRHHTRGDQGAARSLRPRRARGVPVPRKAGAPPSFRSSPCPSASSEVLRCCWCWAIR